MVKMLKTIFAVYHYMLEQSQFTRITCRIHEKYLHTIMYVLHIVALGDILFAYNIHYV